MLSQPDFTDENPKREPDFRRWIIVHRMPFWIYIRIPRPYKEFLKELLFSIFPFFFSGRIEYKHWKDARLFAGKLYSGFTLSFWKKVWKNGEILIASRMPQEVNTNTDTLKLGVAIHAFYPEILNEIIHYLRKEHHLEYHLFVTCPPESECMVRQILSAQMLPHTLHVYENKGRDVLPFLKILSEMQGGGFKYILKIHTKKSSHHINNTGWKNDIFEKLLSPGHILKYTSLLHSIPEIGIIGPEGHILPMAMYYSNNAEKVMQLCEKMGLPTTEFPKLHFVAGTMFYAKMEALQPILDVKLQEEDFEIEKGQVDGTMAHAVERAIGASCLRQNLWLADTQSSTQFIHSKSVMNYKFSI